MGNMSSAHVQRTCPESAACKARRRYVRHCPEETVLYEVVERHPVRSSRIWTSRVGDYPDSCAMSSKRIFATGSYRSSAVTVRIERGACGAGARGPVSPKPEKKCWVFATHHVGAWHP